MAIIYQDGRLVNPSEVPEGTGYDPDRGPGYGWARITGEDKNLFGGFCGEDVVETMDGEWVIVGRGKER